MRALLLIDDGFEDLSVFLPWYRLKEEGWVVHLASPMMHALEGRHGYRLEPDLRIRDANPGDYDLLLIPDGPAVERLRMVEEAVGATRTFAQESQPIASIGHGAQLLLSAGILDDKTIACSPGIRDDVRMAGAAYRDEPVVQDGTLLTGRGCDDLPEFCRALAALAARTSGIRI